MMDIVIAVGPFAFVMFCVIPRLPLKMFESKMLAITLVCIANVGIWYEAYQTFRHLDLMN